MQLMIASEVILIIFLSFLLAAVILFIILVFYILRLLKISTKLKAKQFKKFNTFALPGQIVFLGDSLTEFYQIEEFFYNLKIYNRGIASDTTDGVLERLEENVILIKPRKVFIQIGTNDYHKKNELIFSNIKKIIERIQEALPDTKVYLISLYPINHKAKIYSRLFTSSRKNSRIIELNKLLEEYANNIKIPYIDVHSHLLDEKGNLKKEYTVEGLHISFEGYEVITEVLRPYVLE